MGVGQLSESDAVDALRLPFYSSSHPTGSHGWRNQFDLGNPSYNAKPGCAPAIIEALKADDAMFISMGWAKSKIYADFDRRMNTLVLETEVESLDEYYKIERAAYVKPPEERDLEFQGLVDLINNNVDSGYREIWEVIQ